MVRVVKGALMLTIKEVDCLTRMYNSLNQMFPGQHQDVEVEKILKKLAEDRTITLQQLNTFLRWRRPKGTIAANPCYAQFLERYFRLRRCKTCRGLGHTDQMQTCKDCHGSGFNQKVAHALKDEEAMRW